MRRGAPVRELPQLSLAADKCRRPHVGTEQFDRRGRIGFAGVQTVELEFRTSADDRDGVAIATDLDRDRPGTCRLRLLPHDDRPFWEASLPAHRCGYNTKPAGNLVPKLSRRQRG